MLMDSTEFELGNNNIIDFKQYYITASDSTNRIARIPFCSPHLLPKGRYYVKVTLYKVNANGYIGIFNDISNLQHIGSNWFRTAGSSNRFNRYSNSIQFNTPKLTLGFSKFSNQVFPTANDLKLTINGDSVLCSGQSRTLTAPLGYSYLWSNGATTQSISVNSTAYYSCSLSNTSCSFSSNTIHLRLHAPNAFSIAAQPSTTFCQGDSTRLFVPFNPTTLYSWSNGKTTNAQYVKAGGTYTLTRVDSLGCTKSSSITTTMLSVPPIQITTSGPLSFCPGGSVTLYATAGGSSYLWSTGATSQTITVNATGSYGVSMGLINGCTSRATPVQVVSAAPPASVIASGPLNFCPGESVTLSAPAGYSYLWSNGATTQSITTSAAGSYTVTVSQNGCSSTSAAQVVAVGSSPPATVTASGPATFCQGGSVTLSAPAGYTYLWSNGSTAQSITPTSTGSYSVTVTANGCSSTSAAQAVVVNPVPPSTVSASGPLTFCQGGSVSLSAPAGYSYLWSNGATTQSISPTASGSYTVTVSANGCSSTSAAQAVTVNAIPPSTVSASGSLSLCQGGSVTLSAPAGYAYLWSNGATTQSITASTAGSYSVTVSANGCSSTSAAQAVTVSPLPPSTVSASGPLTFCQGGSVSLSAPAGYTYLWSNGATTQSITAFAAGSYSVTVSANGCSSTSAAQAVVVNPLPSSAVSVSGSLTFCQGSSVTLSAPAGYSYLWSNGATTQSITASTAGSYSVTVSANGCSSTSSAQAVTVNPLPPSTVTASGPLTLCQGGSVTLSAPAGYSYLWSNGSTAQNIVVSASGQYSVTVSANGCSSTSAALAVTVNPNPPANVVASGPLTFCQGGSVALVAPSGYAYVWSNGATTQTINAVASGSYTVTVYGNGCSATSAPIQVSVLPNPSAAVTASGPLTFCQGGSVTLVAPAGATYLWSNGAVTQSITATTSGAYSVVVSSNGCSTGSSVQQVTVLPTPPATVTASGALTFCVGGSVVLTAPAGYSYSWNTGATTASITASTSGTYSVVVSDGTCSATSSGTAVSAVPNNLNPQVFGVAQAPINTVQNYFTSQNLGNGYTWVVSGGSVVSGQGTNAVTVFLGTAGNVKVAVVETNGFCNQSDTLTVKVSGLGSDEGERPQMRLYPNPSNGNFTVETPLPGAALSLFDLLGRRIHHEVMTSDRLELDGIPAGVYVVRAEQGGTVWEERLVVQ
jgi:(2Fe-2S) ferredoxin